ncbi:MAG: acyltransferase [Acidobacteriaceae bacterium]
MKGQQTSGSPRRFHELDSVRGLAALMVVFSHAVLMWRMPWLTETGLLPLLRYPFIAGHEAVMLFFLLSGFVLSLPYLAGKGQPYPQFLARRILRIYGPYLFALGLAVSGAALFQPHSGMHSAWADQTWSKPVSWRLVLEHVGMIGNYEWSQYNTAFWSLIHEMRISLVFPALYLVVSRLGARYGIAVGVALTLLAQELTHFRVLGEQTASTIAFVAIFLLGILTAKYLDRLGDWYSQLPNPGKVLLAAVSFTLYSRGHLLMSSPKVGLWRVAELSTAVGAIGFLILALHSPVAQSFLLSRAPRFLGRISYSLYLVHATVLFAVVSGTRGRLSLPEMFALYLTLSIVAGWAFCVAVEEPFARLSKRVGRGRAAGIAGAIGVPTASGRLHQGRGVAWLGEGSGQGTVDGLAGGGTFDRQRDDAWSEEGAAEDLTEVRGR